MVDDRLNMTRVGSSFVTALQRRRPSFLRERKPRESFTPSSFAGGFVPFDALRRLRDTGVAFSQLDWDGAVIIASGPRGPDRPGLRRLFVDNLKIEMILKIPNAFLSDRFNHPGETGIQIDCRLILQKLPG